MKKQEITGLLAGGVVYAIVNLKIRSCFIMRRFIIFVTIYVTVLCLSLFHIFNGYKGCEEMSFHIKSVQTHT